MNDEEMQDNISQELNSARDIADSVVENNEDEDLVNLPRNVRNQQNQQNTNNSSSSRLSQHQNSDGENEAELDENSSETASGSSSNDTEDEENEGHGKQKRRREKSENKQMPASSRVIMFVSTLCCISMLVFWYHFHFHYSTPFYIEQRTWDIEIQTAVDKIFGKELERSDYGYNAEVVLPYTVDYFNSLFHVDILGETFSYEITDSNSMEVINNQYVRVAVNYNIASLEVYYAQILEYLNATEAEESEMYMDIPSMFSKGSKEQSE